jgi:hypothetical protein
MTKTITRSLPDKQYGFMERLFFLFFPISYTRMYAQSLGALMLVMALFLWSDARLENQLSKNIIVGKITDVKIGSKGGGASGKYSGRSTYYHIQLGGYRRNFLLEDASLFENWQFSADNIKEGVTASFRIMSRDEQNLQKPTTYLVQMNRPWPQETSIVKIYGFSVNGKTILSQDSSIRGQTYNRWFWVMIPLFIYAIFNIAIRTRFKNWTQASDDKDLRQEITTMSKSHQTQNK